MHGLLLLSCFAFLSLLFLSFLWLETMQSLCSHQMLIVQLKRYNGIHCKILSKTQIFGKMLQLSNIKQILMPMKLVNKLTTLMFGHVSVVKRHRITHKSQKQMVKSIKSQHQNPLNRIQNTQLNSKMVQLKT